MSGEIILGYDGSDPARAALDEAARLAQDLGVGLVAVFSYGPPAGETGEVADQRAAVKELVSAVAGEAAERLRELGCAHELMLVDERPAEALVKVADEREARMIVVGGAGQGPIASALLGTTPSRLLRITDRPVLVVRGEAE
jgi:nucleotide-binding universal stress UspA family protein